MIAFEQIVQEIEALNLNLYDFAICTQEGVQSHYFRFCNACNDSYSVGKVFVMSAVGILYDEGLIHPEDRIAALMKETVPAGVDPGWRLVSVEQALTHRIGFSEDFLDIDVDDTTKYPTDDYLALVFDHPLGYPPGAHYEYSDAASYLLARLVEHVSGRPTDQLLAEKLLIPMGFREVAWSRCPRGHMIGATGMYARASDIVKLGWLYLNGGVYEDKRLLSPRWVRRALEREYEFRMITPGGLIGKGGTYGQCVALSREGHFAAAWHACEDARGIDRLINYVDALARR